MATIHATGTLFQMGDGGTPTEVFTTIADVTAINGVNITRDTIDSTTHDNSSGFRTFIGGLADGGDVTIDINFDPTASTHIDATGILSKLVASSLPSATTNFRIVYGSSLSKRWNFAGIVTGFSPAAPVGDKLSASVTIKVSGKPTLTANS